DGFQDADGCPDPDNDQDGILDVDDKCPNNPENMNGVEDHDGCPEGADGDRDGDGIPDSLDKCPIRPKIATVSRTPTAVPTRTTIATEYPTRAISARTTPRTATASRMPTAVPIPTTITMASPTRTTGARTNRRPTTATRIRTAARTRGTSSSRAMTF